MLLSFFMCCHDSFYGRSIKDITNIHIRAPRWPRPYLMQIIATYFNTWCCFSSCQPPRNVIVDTFVSPGIWGKKHIYRSEKCPRTFCSIKQLVSILNVEMKTPKNIKNESIFNFLHGLMVYETIPHQVFLEPVNFLLQKKWNVRLCAAG